MANEPVETERVRSSTLVGTLYDALQWGDARKPGKRAELFKKLISDAASIQELIEAREEFQKGSHQEQAMDATKLCMMIGDIMDYFQKTHGTELKREGGKISIDMKFSAIKHFSAPMVDVKATGVIGVPRPVINLNAVGIPTPAPETPRTVNSVPFAPRESGVVAVQPPVQAVIANTNKEASFIKPVALRSRVQTKVGILPPGFVEALVESQNVQADTEEGNARLLENKEKFRAAQEANQMLIQLNEKIRLLNDELKRNGVEVSLTKTDPSKDVQGMYEALKKQLRFWNVKLWFNTQRKLELKVCMSDVLERMAELGITEGSGRKSK